MALGLGSVALAAVGVMAALALSGRDRSQAPVSTDRPLASTTGERGDVRGESAEHRAPAATDSAPRQLFGRTSVWNRRLDSEMGIDPASPTLVAALGAEVQRERQAGTGPGVATDTSFFRVPAGQRPSRVRLDADEAPALTRAFAAVPIPRDAKPADGPNRHMTLWQPSTDRLWELASARRGTGGWHARWGGAFRDVSRSRGYYDAAAWPGATEYWGATGSGFPVIGGTVMVSDLKRGRIAHALALGVPVPRAGAFAWPAQRTDGTGPLAALPEGATLRLDPQLDVDALELPRLVRMIARAAQVHGLVVRGTNARGVSFFAEDPPTGRANPYREYLLGKTWSRLLAGFPWDRLQVLEMHLCWSAPCRRR
jgi:hypothetical protein